MIPDRWYPILESAKLRAKPVGLTRMGRKLVLWRDAAGEPVAMPWACPHRGAAFDGGRSSVELACPWHGFRFDGSGQCTCMPCEGARGADSPHPGPCRTPAARSPRAGLALVGRAAEPKYPPIAFFDELAADSAQRPQASYVLPYHYTRMMETNLDLHHTPVRPRLRHSRRSVRAWTRTKLASKATGSAPAASCARKAPPRGSLPRRRDPALPGPDRAHGRSYAWSSPQRRSTTGTPGSGFVTTRTTRACRSAPTALVDRRASRAARCAAAGLAHLRRHGGGTIDEAPHHYVHADKGIALYRRRRRQLLAAEAERRKPGRADGHPRRARGTARPDSRGRPACFAKKGFTPRRWTTSSPAPVCRRGHLLALQGQGRHLPGPVRVNYAQAIFAGLGPGRHRQRARRTPTPRGRSAGASAGEHGSDRAWTEFLRHPKARRRFAKLYRARGPARRHGGARDRARRDPALQPEHVAAIVTAVIEGLLLQAFADPTYDPRPAWPTAWEIISRGLASNSPS